MNKQMKAFCDRKKKDPEYYEVIQKRKIDMTPINILLGPNGTGKTMSLRTIEEECNDKGLVVCRFYTGGFNPVNDRYFRPERLITAFHSEGEHLKESIEFWFGDYVIKELLSHEKDVYILIDQIDSGMSIDKMLSFVNDMLFILNEEKKKHPNRKIRFVFTSNSYEFIDIFKNDTFVSIYWVPTKSIMKVGTYEKFRERYLEYYSYMHKEE